MKGRHRGRGARSEAAVDAAAYRDSRRDQGVLKGSHGITPLTTSREGRGGGQTQEMGRGRVEDSGGVQPGRPLELGQGPGGAATKDPIGPARNGDTCRGQGFLQVHHGAPTVSLARKGRGRHLGLGRRGSERYRDDDEPDRQSDGDHRRRHDLGQTTKHAQSSAGRPENLNIRDSTNSSPVGTVGEKVAIRGEKWLTEGTGGDQDEMTRTGRQRGAGSAGIRRTS